MVSATRKQYLKDKAHDKAIHKKVSAHRKAHPEEWAAFSKQFPW